MKNQPSIEYAEYPPNADGKRILYVIESSAQSREVVDVLKARGESLRDCRIVVLMEAETMGQGVQPARPFLTWQEVQLTNGNYAGTRWMDVRSHRAALEAMGTRDGNIVAIHSPVLDAGGPKAAAATRQFLADLPESDRHDAMAVVLAFGTMMKGRDTSLDKMTPETAAAWLKDWGQAVGQDASREAHTVERWMRYIEDARGEKKPTLAEQLAAGKSLGGTTVKQPGKDMSLERE